jgi:hypothetical protein
MTDSNISWELLTGSGYPKNNLFSGLNVDLVKFRIEFFIF